MNGEKIDNPNSERWDEMGWDGDGGGQDSVWTRGLKERGNQKEGGIFFLARSYA